MSDTAADHPDWNAVLGHELRSPVAAILGYQELLDEGTFGPLPPAAADAVHRIRLAADQLLSLIDAVECSSATAAGSDDPAPVPAADLIAEAAASVRFEAEGRDATIAVEDGGVEFLTRRPDAVRALALVLGAAVKVSPGLTLRVAAREGDVPCITVAGARLDPAQDLIAPDIPLTGAGLRLELARVSAALAEGSVELDAAGSVYVALPRLAPGTPLIDGAEHLP